MSYANQLYQQMILDHNKKPRNFRPMENATHVCPGRNPLCGDDITVYARVENDGIEDVSFQGKGCSICMSSASMMTEFVKGKTTRQAQDSFAEFHRMILGELDPNTMPNTLGKLKVFEGVKEYPARTKCASLPWHTLNGALSRTQEVSTE